MNDEQLLRYSRHVLLGEFDIAGQEALLAAKVLIIGAGGLGCPAAMYLASAGVGELIIVDDDVVELSNLQRQIGHQQDSLSLYKVDSLQKTLLGLNPEVVVNAVRYRLSEEQLHDYVANVDVVLDCSDNFSTRFLLNRVCFEHRIPLVSGAAVRSEGQLMVFDFRSGKGPCYRCVYHDEVVSEAANCATNGVLAPLVGIVGSLQAAETIKILAGYGASSEGRLLVLDLFQGEWRQLRFKQDRQCPVCGGESHE